MDKTYEAPALVELGDFRAVTGAGIGTAAEGWWPLADRAS
ncbi:MAG: keywimysin-related RiPP [Actinomyces sp.]|nr:keywimysin-related RiPP [Actinomyces sp.]MDN5985059.1 keywimysin-related RiPP [Propionibacterium sp.]MDN6566437.1 keywimysin-related RiPP [Actinomyces sp.]MDN6793656.1 keywimysin-related RiPP [Propionibacterium sp.]